MGGGHGKGGSPEDAHPRREESWCSQRWPVFAEHMVLELRAKVVVIGL